jgi:hypothetical protein
MYIFIATVVDPNGLCIKLIEMKNPLLLVDEVTDSGNSSKKLSNLYKTKSFLMEKLEKKKSNNKFKLSERQKGATYEKQFETRLGYLVVPCDLSNEVAMFYQSNFSVLVSAAPVGVEQTAAQDIDIMKSINEAAANSSAGTVKDTVMIRTGFSVVDREDFPEVLSAYTWLGNGLRSKHTCLCLLQQVDRKSASISKSIHRSRSISENSKSLFASTLLVGIGFEVKDLFVKLAEMELRGIEFESSDPVYVAGVGLTTIFNDPNDLRVELSDGDADVRNSIQNMSSFQREVQIAKSRRTLTLGADRSILDKYSNLEKERAKRESTKIASPSTLVRKLKLRESSDALPRNSITPLNMSPSSSSRALPILNSSPSLNAQNMVISSVSAGTLPIYTYFHIHFATNKYVSFFLNRFYFYGR